MFEAPPSCSGGRATRSPASRGPPTALEFRSAPSGDGFFKGLSLPDDAQAVLYRGQDSDVRSRCRLRPSSARTHLGSGTVLLLTVGAEKRVRTRLTNAVTCWRSVTRGALTRSEVRLDSAMWHGLVCGVLPNSTPHHRGAFGVIVLQMASFGTRPCWGKEEFRLPTKLHGLRCGPSPPISSVNCALNAFGLFAPGRRERGHRVCSRSGNPERMPLLGNTA